MSNGRDDDKTPASIKDLEWLFGRADSAMGYSAQGYEPSESGTWTQARVDGLHVARLVSAGNDVAEKHAAILGRYRRLPEVAQVIAQAAFSPRSWDPILASACGRAGRVPLVGVVVFLVAVDALETSSVTVQVERLVSAARKDGREKFFRPLTARAKVLLEGCLAQYDAVVAEDEASAIRALRYGAA